MGGYTCNLSSQFAFSGGMNASNPMMGGPQVNVNMGGQPGNPGQQPMPGMNINMNMGGQPGNPGQQPMPGMNIQVSGGTGYPNQ